ncbi:bifunctional 2-polyprenyl-6-hydroxyphenol methylase/3-demethylubiquinol 3-O-methyltransferase UbiG [Micromonospora sp. HUAS LYJ1]|uniref:class I SAM-dependent methyltransferase n=1 Tax=Micromonospora sp. HUAS LYJ1 TaxID=3061626 RepID=UPI002672DFC1|nr:class I SAM-dependent methyltransferase [Micromonospora sp. HUAS LYJ1]WKU05382.1 class I SAM-dependent methyltransferase [Micromonospora sp. HUAS LYJ1]
MSDGNLLTDNPELYEQQFPDPGHHAARFVDDVVRRFADRTDAAPRLLDVGCGTGRDVGYLATLGYAAVGLDTSVPMLTYARRRHPGVRFVHADLRDFELAGPVDVVTCLDSALLYCHTNADLTAFLRCCHRHLRPGGLLLAEMRNGAFFLGNTELLDGIRTRTVTWRGIPYTSGTRLWIDHGGQLLRRERVWTWPACPQPLVQTSAWRLLFPAELRYLLDTTGFDVVALFDAPGPRTDPPWQPSAALSSALSGDRLHLVARRRVDPA